MIEEKTQIGGGFVISGAEAITQEEEAPEPTADGFPSDWHRARYIHDLKRNVSDAEARLASPDLSEEQRELAEYEKQAAEAELRRLGEKP